MRSFVIVLVLLAIGSVCVLLLGWENFSLIWIRIPYDSSEHSKNNIDWIGDCFAEAGLSPTDSMQMPAPPRTDIVIRSGTSSSDRHLRATYSGTVANHYECHAWLYDDPSRSEYIVVVSGPGKLSLMQACEFRPAWNKIKTLLHKAFRIRNQEKVN
jgi:hypothetical protein